MSYGRIEVYIHENNRSGIMVEITCETEDTEKSLEFIEFCKFAAKMFYESKCIEEKRLFLEKKFNEKIKLRNFHKLEIKKEIITNHDELSPFLHLIRK